MENNMSIRTRVVRIAAGLFSAAAVLFCNTFIDITDCAANKKGLPGWAQSVIAFARRVSRLPMEIFEAIGAN